MSLPPIRQRDVFFLKTFNSFSSRSFFFFNSAFLGFSDKIAEMLLGNS